MRKPSMAKARLVVLSVLLFNAVLQVVVDVKYIGFDMDPVWVVGYGLDYNEVRAQSPAAF